jgi:NAD(P)-dependent dehydrogenase (short-subunit alcohol dehydrogenase family)
MALGLAADGAEVVIHCHRSTDAAEALAARIIAAGGRAYVLAADLADRGARAEVIARATALAGPLDVLINNASSFRYDDFPGFSEENWDFHLSPNLEAPVFLARDFARVAPVGGSIVNLLDFKVTALNPDFFTYTIAKAALAAATGMMAQAMAGKIRVNGIAPGITLISGKQTDAGFARAFAATPLGRSSTPAEILAGIRYILATPSLNGEILVLDGGESLLPRGRDIAYAVGLS